MKSYFDLSVGPKKTRSFGDEIIKTREAVVSWLNKNNIKAVMLGEPMKAANWKYKITSVRIADNLWFGKPFIYLTNADHDDLILAQVSRNFLRRLRKYLS